MQYSDKADERDAQRRAAAARRGPQHLSVLARVHGAIRAAIPVGGRQDHRRLLRHHARAHQADPLRSPLAAAGPDEHCAVTVEEPAAKAARRWPRFPSARSRKLGAKLAAGKFVAFVEILPPRGVDASQGNRRRAALRGARHRLHQRARRPARQRPHERAGHLPAHPARGRHRSRQPLLLPRPQYSRHPIGAAGRARGRRSQPDLHHRRSAAHGHLSRTPPRYSTSTPSAWSTS